MKLHATQVRLRKCLKIVEYVNPVLHNLQSTFFVVVDLFFLCFVSVEWLPWRLQRMHSAHYSCVYLGKMQHLLLFRICARQPVGSITMSIDSQNLYWIKWVTRNWAETHAVDAATLKSILIPIAALCDIRCTRSGKFFRQKLRNQSSSFGLNDFVLISFLSSAHSITQSGRNRGEKKKTKYFAVASHSHTHTISFSFSSLFRSQFGVLYL